MATTDVTVRGAGIFGLSVAWACLARGARVRVVDPAGIGAGASGGLVGALAPHVPGGWNPKKQFQLESLLMAAEWWAEIARVSGQDPGYARFGRLIPLADEAAVALARDRAAEAQRLWDGQGDGQAAWRIVGTDAFPGWAPATPTGLMVHDTLSARMHPRRALSALAGAIRARGGEIVAGAEAAEEGAVVHATGWQGLADLGQALGRTVGSGEKGQALVLALDRREMPQLFVDGVHIVPHADGTTAIGSTSERDFDSPDRPDALLDDVHRRALAACPALEGAAVLERWAGVRPRARTRAPLLGPWPGRPGHFVANGGYKIGFGIAPKVGEVIADQVLEGRDSIPEGCRIGDAS